MTPTQATAVMIFGAVVALSGVLVLVYARTAGSNRIRAFTLEFELSTPALVVFLAGCGLIVAPFLLPRTPNHPQPLSDPTPVADSEAVTTMPALDTGVQTCDDGEQFALEILKPSVSGSVMRIPVRIKNPTVDVTATIFSHELAVADLEGRVLDPIHGEWTPPLSLQPGTFYEGRVDLRTNPGETLAGVTMHTRANASCPDVAARITF